MKRGEFVLPRMFSDNMVLQQNTRIPVWGKAPDGEEVTIEFLKRRKTAKAVSGSWRIELEPARAGGPYEMTVSCGGREIVIGNIAVGEVWVAGGQSNMGYSFKEIYGEEKEWMREAFDGDFSMIRLFKAAEYAADEPAEDVNGGEWSEVSGDIMPRLAAVPVFFGCALRRRLNVPVGIVQASRSGTKATCWIPRRLAESDPTFEGRQGYRRKESKGSAGVKDAGRYLSPVTREELAEEQGGMGMDDPRRPFAFYNGMVSPLQPFAMRGVIWYQGESDALELKARRYAELFPALIEAWRSDWGGRAFPFLYVQLPDYSEGGGEWGLIKDAQRRTLELVPNTGMIAIDDLGETDNLHPRNKRPVGERLALLAANYADGEKGGVKDPFFPK